MHPFILVSPTMFSIRVPLLSNWNGEPMISAFENRANYSTRGTMGFVIECERSASYPILNFKA